MSKEAVFTLKIEPELRDRFMAAARALDRPASQLVRELMRDFVERQAVSRDHEGWFRSEVEQALREADDPSVARTSDGDVARSWATERAALIDQADG